MSPKEMENVWAASGDAAHSPYPDTGRYPWRRSVIRADAISAGRAHALIVDAADADLSIARVNRATRARAIPY